MTVISRDRVVVNLWFVKHSNGLFHYGLDYAEALGSALIAVWVRDRALAQAVRRRLPHAHVRILSPCSLILALAKLVISRALLFTPSSHPIAFIRRQIVVVHDSYPFAGHLGRVKLALFRAAMKASKASAGYINRADARAFLGNCGLPPERMQFLPNGLGPATAVRSTSRPRSSSAIVGLFGSDSFKKNYDALFAAAVGQPQVQCVTWRIFGHANAYTERLLRDFSTLAIEVVESDRQTMEMFVDDLDVAVSVAEGEGFARPVAMALMRGVPTLLLKTPVFEEFYADSTTLFETPTALVFGIAAALDNPAPSGFAREADLRADFATAVQWLRQKAA